MAKYAWFKYPIIPETTIRILGTARTMITDVVGNVQKNIFKDMISERQRIGSMVKETAADDFHTYTYVYKKPQNSSPFAQFAKYPNAMIAYGPTGMNSRMDDVLGVLDEINVKSNVHRPNYRQYRQIRLANTTQQIKLNPTSTVQQANPTKPSQFRIVADDGDEIKNFKPSNRNNQIINKHRKSEMRSQYAVNNGKVEINEGESKVNRQYTLPKPEYIHTLPPGYSGINTNAIVYNEYPNNPNSNYGSPAHLTSSYLAPSYNGPAAEYGPPTSPAVQTYGQPGGIGEINVNTEEFTDHKPETNKGGWLMVDLERIILEKFGLLGSAKHVTVLKCGQYYAAGFIWRTLAELMDKGL